MRFSGQLASRPTCNSHHCKQFSACLLVRQVTKFVPSPDHTPRQFHRTFLPVSFAFHNEFVASSVRWWLSVDLEHGLEKILDDLILALLTGLLDLLDFGLGFLVCFFLGLLVALCVL